MGRRRKSQEEEYVKDEEPRIESIDGERGRRLMRRLHRYVHGEEDGVLTRWCCRQGHGDAFEMAANELPSVSGWHWLSPGGE